MLLKKIIFCFVIVNEDAMNGTVVIILTTHDADIGLNARVAYYITKGDPNGHFNIRPTGEIYVNKVLREKILPACF